ncbi:hypothetical protein C8K36_11068 [Rhodococcus sp. OK519]|uniref:hypothetical protein n=1 Tax=Rhodococcus sp. OK519 TaxID=2135729 RepID=UPI000D360ABE|nr:hypothetical protein C8K36_11068 [Rhodococcus sp. OK519]
MSAFIRAMRVVGDLDDEFYRDERQRDVWNEAAAVGLQLFLWVALVAAAVLPWAADVAGAWIALGLLLESLVISACVLAFARSRNVDPRETGRMARPRAVLALALYLTGAVGIIAGLLTPSSDEPSATWAGVAVGAVAGGTAAAIALRAKRRRWQRAEAEEA